MLKTNFIWREIIEKDRAKKSEEIENDFFARGNR